MIELFLILVVMLIVIGCYYIYVKYNSNVLNEINYNELETRKKELEIIIKNQEKQIHNMKVLFYYLCDNIHNIGTISKPVDCEILQDNLLEFQRIFSSLRERTIIDSLYNEDVELLYDIVFICVADYESKIRNNTKIKDSNIQDYCLKKLRDLETLDLKRKLNTKSFSIDTTKYYEKIHEINS